VIVKLRIFSEVFVFVVDLFGDKLEQTAQRVHHGDIASTGTINGITSVFVEDSSTPAFRITGSGENWIFGVILDQAEVV